ncbi:MAG TPA: glycosyltransferase family 2 protein [Rhizomicrobium sp.]|jgi:hypothetical protein|nr:glycosyltransferase family 2 protein [Rhizomicrobium sp.]
MSKAGTAAIITTLRNAGPVLDSFVAYHRAIGFAHMFLFFDDLNDPDLRRAGAMPGVTAIPHDLTLRKAWRDLRSYPRLNAFVDNEVMARQQLNVEFAMGLARAAGYRWLLSIDADELFFSPNEAVAHHFESLTATAYEAINYPNYEAVPTRENIDDFFREVDIFKPPPALAQSLLIPALRHAEQTIPQLRPYFHYYLNGKSAVRLTANSLEPAGVHKFRRSEGTTNIASSTGAFILHYPCCGFESFWTKYTTLGRISDKWWGTDPIGPFHLASRDVILSGDRNRARAFYQDRIAISDTHLVEKLLGSGVLVRLPQPRQIIEAARGYTSII